MHRARCASLWSVKALCLHANIGRGLAGASPPQSSLQRCASYALLRRSCRPQWQPWPGVRAGWVLWCSLKPAARQRRRPACLMAACQLSRSWCALKLDRTSLSACCCLRCALLPARSAGIRICMVACKQRGHDTLARQTACLQSMAQRTMQLAGVQDVVVLERWQQRGLVSSWASVRQKLAGLADRKAELLRRALVSSCSPQAALCPENASAIMS